MRQAFIVQETLSITLPADAAVLNFFSALAMLSDGTPLTHLAFNLETMHPTLISRDDTV
jgi:hypothetical protein